MLVITQYIKKKQSETVVCKCSDKSHFLTFISLQIQFILVIRFVNGFKLNDLKIN